MLTPEQATERLDHLLGLAAQAGADAADAGYFGESSTGIGVRLGTLEDISRSEGEEIGLRVFLGDRSAQVSVSDMSPMALSEAVERAIAMAREATSDPYAALAPAGMLASGPFPDLDLFDGAVETLSAARLKEMALEAEDAARAVPGITSSEGGSAGAGASIAVLATSHGFRGVSTGTSVSASAVVIAGDGDARERDYAWHATRHLVDLDSMLDIGRRAGERTIRRLNPTKAPTGAMPVVFDKRVSATIIGHLLGAITGSSIARRTSFLLDREGEQIFAPGITIRDEPHLVRGLRSRMFDGEGLPTAPRSIIDKGRLTGWLMDNSSARQLGRQPTGHASRSSSGPAGISTSNLWMEAGRVTLDELIKDIKIGLYVNELIGMGVNLLTGDYSRGASGFMIRDGMLAEPVTEATIAGDLADMFLHLTPANDLALRHATNAPSLRVDGMTVAGQ